MMVTGLSNPRLESANGKHRKGPQALIRWQITAPIALRGPWRQWRGTGGAWGLPSVYHVLT